MERLFYFVYRYRDFFIFLLLEGLSGWLIIRNNQYHSSFFFNSSNHLVSSIFTLRKEGQEYFSLKKINENLANENAFLKTALERKRQSFYSLTVAENKDADVVNRFTYIEAKVINNSFANFRNYMTINRGAKGGLKVGMPIVHASHAIGKVKYLSDHYAVVISLLNVDLYVSSIIKNTHHFGTIKWDGQDARYTRLLYIPRHALPVVGDTVITSGYNAIFPYAVQIGIISKINLEKKDRFYDIEVALAEDFTNLSFVQAVENTLISEKKELEMLVLDTPHE